MEVSNEALETYIYEVVEDYIRPATIDRMNRLKKWKYGYDKEHDVIVISKTGKIGEIYDIQGLKVALPKEDKVYSRSKKKEEQYWEAFESPKELDAIDTILEWEDYPEEFKEKWTPYIDEEFRRREEGFWFLNNGKATYISPTHYMYLQHSKIDVGHPDYRESNRIFYIFWEACKADPRCYGMCFLKNRRSGASFMAAAEAVNTATQTQDARIGVLSKTGNDAKKLFTDKIVPMSINYPFFFKPVQDGMDRPKQELAYRVPALRLTRKRLVDRQVNETGDLKGLNTTIDWKPTGDNSYDGEKLQLLIHDESGKWEKPADITENWRVTKTCLRVGRNIVGKCMMVSTSNALNKGGEGFQKIFNQSNVQKRNKNGQTTSGLYSLFIPMEWNYEGYIDRYGMPVFRNPEKPVIGVDGEIIDTGVIDYWEGEVDGFKNSNDAEGLNEHFRQFPRTTDHAFRDEAQNSLFNLNKIYEQIDYNGDMTHSPLITRGNFRWKQGLRDKEVEFVPNPKGRFEIAWIPPAHLQNAYKIKNGMRVPANEHLGCLGLDSYDIEGTTDGRGSKASCHGLTKGNTEQVPKNFCFLRYNARPPQSSIMFEDILMACVFYGMPILAESNKPRFLYHMYHRGFRAYSMNRVDRTWNQLSTTEKLIGGQPNSGNTFIRDHAEALERFVDDHIGHLGNGEYGTFLFNKTLNDLTKFNLSKRTLHDDSISLGLAIVGNNKFEYHPVARRQMKKINVGFAKYKQKGLHSTIINRDND